MTIFGIMFRYKNARDTLGRVYCTRKKIKKHARVVRMDGKRLKITLKVLNNVKQEYPTTKIEDRLEEECSKENISVDEGFFFFFFFFTYWKEKS